MILEMIRDEDMVLEMIKDEDMVDIIQMDNMLTITEVAALLHVHPNTLRRWSDEGRIRAYRITMRGDRRFRRQDIARFLDKLNGNRHDEEKVSGR